MERSAFSDGRLSPRYKFRASRNDTIQKMRFVLNIESSTDKEFESQTVKKRKVSHQDDKENINHGMVFPRCYVKLKRLSDSEITNSCELVNESFQLNPLQENVPKDEKSLTAKKDVKKKVAMVPSIRVRTVEEINRL